VRSSLAGFVIGVLPGAGATIASAMTYMSEKRMAGSSGKFGDGDLRALAVTAGKRQPQLPDVPTAQEAGVKGYDVASWNALAAPAKTPRAVVERVNQELRKALAAPEVQKRFQELGVDPRPSSPGELRDFFVSESARWTKVVEAAKIPKQ